MCNKRVNYIMIKFFQSFARSSVVLEQPSIGIVVYQFSVQSVQCVPRLLAFEELTLFMARNRGQPAVLPVGSFFRDFE